MDHVRHLVANGGTSIASNAPSQKIEDKLTLQMLRIGDIGGQGPHLSEEFHFASKFDDSSICPYFWIAFCTGLELAMDGPRETGVFKDTQNPGEGDD